MMAAPRAKLTGERWRMWVRVSLLILGVCFWKGGRADPEVASGCHGVEVERVAEEALSQINADRTLGYIFTLNRVYDVRQGAGEKGEGVVFNMTIDVLETHCHVISRKPWKECVVREVSAVPVYGQCKTTVFVGKSVVLHGYKCIVRQVPATVIVDTCPDCPTAERLDEPIVIETANLSLQKYNRESGLANYFSLLNLTGASMQAQILVFCSGWRGRPTLWSSPFRRQSALGKLGLWSTRLRANRWTVSLHIQASVEAPTPQ